MHKIIGTHVIVKQMGVKTDENCSFCNNVKYSIEHIFWQCAGSQTFWTSFINLVNKKCYNVHNMRLSQCLVILGIDDNTKIDSVFYFVLLLACQTTLV